MRKILTPAAADGQAGISRRQVLISGTLAAYRYWLVQVRTRRMGCA
jgi:hypothetical protein